MKNKKILKVKYVDFWAEIKSDFFLDILKSKYDVVFDDDPDLLFFSVFSDEHLKYNCHKVFYTGENVKPNKKLCDFSFSFEPSDGKNFQFPYFARHELFENLRTNTLPDSIQKLRSSPKNNFCNFIYSNPRAKERIDFCEKLASYKRIDCPGKVLNNMLAFKNGLHDWPEKIDFLSNYKFTIAFENEKSDYYTTEKIYHPLIAGSIPIYWGDEKIIEYFNPDSFINCNDFDSFDDVIDYVKEVDNDEILYKKYLDAQLILPNSRLHSFSRQKTEAFLFNIIENGFHTPPVSRGIYFQLYKAFYLFNKVCGKFKKRIRR